MQSGIEVIYTSDSDADRFLMAEAKFLRALGASKVMHQVDCVLGILCLDNGLCYLGLHLYLHLLSWLPFLSSPDMLFLGTPCCSKC